MDSPGEVAAKGRADGPRRQTRGCVVLVMYTTSYNVDAFVAACQNAGVRAVIASDRCHVLDSVWQWPTDSLIIDFYDPAGSAEAIAASAQARGLSPVRAVIPVGGEVAALVATLAAQRLGLLSNGPAAVEAAANKLRMRELCAKVAAQRQPLRVPSFRVFPFDADPGQVASVVARELGWPCVIKPLLLSASRGVMRVDDPGGLALALARLHKFLSKPALLNMGGESGASRQVLVEAFVPGAEVAVEALLTAGEMRTLAFFDKPDPLDGPLFEETIYVTPSRHPQPVQLQVEEQVRLAARALGLTTGPVHAEVRLAPEGPVVIEVAARSIGGLCSRTLRFGTGLSLEDLLVRHALGSLQHDDDGEGKGDAGRDAGGAGPGGWVAAAAASAALSREQAAAGVMMIPIPRAGVLKEVGGIPAARAQPGIEDVVISVPVGDALVPLPEGASYLGFIFARGDSPEQVEAALRAAHARLTFEIAPLLPVS